MNYEEFKLRLSHSGWALIFNDTNKSVLLTNINRLEEEPKAILKSFLRDFTEFKNLESISKFFKSISDDELKSNAIFKKLIFDRFKKIYGGSKKIKNGDLTSISNEFRKLTSIFTILWVDAFTDGSKFFTIKLDNRFKKKKNKQPKHLSSQIEIKRLWRILYGSEPLAKVIKKFEALSYKDYGIKIRGKSLYIEVGSVFFDFFNDFIFRNKPL